jgi:hypothetical protein
MLFIRLATKLLVLRFFSKRKLRLSEAETWARSQTSQRNLKRPSLKWQKWISHLCPDRDASKVMGQMPQPGPARKTQRCHRLHRILHQLQNGACQKQGKDWACLLQWRLCLLVKTKEPCLVRILASAASMLASSMRRTNIWCKCLQRHANACNGTQMLAPSTEEPCLARIPAWAQVFTKVTKEMVLAQTHVWAMIRFAFATRRETHMV